MSASELSEESKVRLAKKVTWVGFAVNAVLAVMKITAGIIGRSSAMVADGVHSVSDFVTDAIVLIFVGIARRKENQRYQYGHGKYETFATMLIAFALCIVAILFFIDGARSVYGAMLGKEPERPRMIALVMAIASIVSKESIYRYTIGIGQRISSAIIIANAWHHRSDSLSSIATLAGIAGAMFLGPQWRILDPIAAIIVSIFILIIAIKLAKPAIIELLDGAIPDEALANLYKIIESTPEIKAFHRLRTRRNGSKTIIELHLKVDPDMTVEESHSIATDVEKKIRQEFSGNAIVTTHIEPYHNEKVKNDKLCSENT